VADIDTNEHGLHVGHLVRELEVEEISTHLGVDLLQDVRGLGKIELHSVARGHNLRRDLVDSVQVFVGLIKLLISEHSDNDFREAILSLGHVVLDFSL